MGSTNRAITALKATFQTPLYPLLDQVRSALGAKIDLELAHLKVNCAVFCHLLATLYGLMPNKNWALSHRDAGNICSSTSVINFLMLPSRQQ